MDGNSKAGTELGAVQKTDAWGDKFVYGALSTLVSSAMLAGKYRFLIKKLATPDATAADHAKMRSLVGEMKAEYMAHTSADVEALYNKTVANPRTIYDARRSVANLAGNGNFIPRMKDKAYAWLKPVDNVLSSTDFKYTMQFNAHRGVYNEGLGIPRNTVASVVNGYVSGIRSIEFDVLETKSPEWTNVVVHDLNLNRLNGMYEDPPLEVSKHPYADLANQPIDLLNPIASAPSVLKTGLKGVMKTRDYLRNSLACTTGMTFYVDARNMAPVSFFKLLEDEVAGGDKLDMCNHVVTKVYPFELNGGTADIVQAFAARYCSGSKTDARQRLTRLKPNVLLAIGGINSEVAETVFESMLDDYGSTEFSWKYFQQRVLPLLPYSTHNIDAAQNKVGGTPIFNLTQLQNIEARSYMALKWITDFSAVSNVRVLQMAMLPSLQIIAKGNNTAEYNEMTDPAKGGKIEFAYVSAVTDNLVTFYQLVMKNTPGLSDISIRGANSTTLQACWDPVAWGSSDRYPDFGVCKWNSSAPYLPSDTSINHYYYGMPSTVTEYKTYSHYKMRNSKAIIEKIHEAKEQQGLPFAYLTTDLPEDLRAELMKMTGIAGWHLPVKYRLGGMISRNTLPKEFSPSTFEVPTWTTSMFQATRDSNTTLFDESQASYKKALNDLTKSEKALAALKSYYRVSSKRPVVLVNPVVLQKLKIEQVYWTEPLADSQYQSAESSLTNDIKMATEALKALELSFYAAFGVAIDGGAVPTPTSPVARLPPDYPEDY